MLVRYDELVIKLLCKHVRSKRCSKKNLFFFFTKLSILHGCFSQFCRVFWCMLSELSMIHRRTYLFNNRLFSFFNLILNSSSFRATFSTPLVFSPSFGSVFLRAFLYAAAYHLRFSFPIDFPQPVPLDTFPCPPSFCCLHVVLFSLSFLDCNTSQSISFLFQALFSCLFRCCLYRHLLWPRYGLGYWTFHATATSLRLSCYSNQPDVPKCHSQENQRSPEPPFCPSS